MVHLLLLSAKFDVIPHFRLLFISQSDAYYTWKSIHFFFSGNITTHRIHSSFEYSDKKYIQCSLVFLCQRKIATNIFVYNRLLENFKICLTPVHCNQNAAHRYPRECSIHKAHDYNRSFKNRLFFFDRTQSSKRFKLSSVSCLQTRFHLRLYVCNVYDMEVIVILIAISKSQLFSIIIIVDSI